MRASRFHLLALLCGLGCQTFAADAPAKKPADATKAKADASSSLISVQKQRQQELSLEAKISAAYNLATVQKQPGEAKALLGEALAKTNSVHIRVKALRILARVEQNLKNYDAVDACYRQIGEALAAPGNPTENVRRCGHTALDGLMSDYQGFLMESKRAAPNLAELRSKIATALDHACEEPANSNLDAQLKNKLAGLHLQMARAFAKDGKNEEACAEFELIFTKHPDFVKQPGRGANLGYEWIKAHGLPSDSKLHLELLQRVYNHPSLKEDPYVANLGVHLGAAYARTKHPHEEFHWQSLIGQIEGFRKQPHIDKAISEILQTNYEGALMNYASKLHRRGEKQLLPEVLRKLEVNFPDGEGGKTARQIRMQLGDSSK